MGREAAIVTAWTQAVPGREEHALEVFMDYLTFFGKQAAEGNCTEPEAYIAQDGSQGLGIVKGSSDVLARLMDSDEVIELTTRAQLSVNGISAKLFYTGDEVTQQTAKFAQLVSAIK